MRGLLVAAAAALAAGEAYGPIASLPGYTMKQKMWSGYITVNETAGRALFFWFVESANDPVNDPLVYWTNGGPGCSGIGGGLFSEQGPFRPDPAGSGGLIDNPWAWSNSANMIFIEQPAGVGFSYSNTTSDYTVGDARAAADVYAFLQGFLAQPDFSHLADNDLYISGESYGGHYVPTTTAYIINQNLNNAAQPKLNLKGFLVGNAWTDAYYDNTGAVLQWYWHGMVSNATATGILNTCNMSDVGPLARDMPLREEDVTTTHAASGMALARGSMGFKPNAPVRTTAVNPATGMLEETWSLPTLNGKSCNDYQNDATAQMGNTDIYDVYSDVCTATGKGAAATRFGGNKRNTAGAKQQQRAAARVTAGGAAEEVDSNNNAGCAIEYDPCIDTKTAAYLNSPAVQAAIHVNPSTIPTGTWSGCSSVVNYSYQDLLTSVIPVHQYILTNMPTGRFLVFSGDVDGIVPFTGTRLWMDSMGLPVTTDLHPYNTPQGQVAGWSQTYGGPGGSSLIYATVRNAGHLVPGTQASRALQMFNTFITGGTF